MDLVGVYPASSLVLAPKSADSVPNLLANSPCLQFSPLVPFAGAGFRVQADTVLGVVFVATALPEGRRGEPLAAPEGDTSTI